jgi:multimeric flavodoxin WrbA
MKTLILDGSEKNDEYSKIVNDTVYNVLKKTNASMTNIILHEHDIKGCIGDMGCFFKTPGKCMFDDVAREIPEQYVESDLVVFITPVTFGGFSALFAKAYDRIVIQLESHLLEMSSEGELHRKKRYNTTYPSLLAIGIEETRNMENRDVFKALVQRNAFHHLSAPACRCVFLTTEDINQDEMTTTIQNVLSEIGGKHDEF